MAVDREKVNQAAQKLVEKKRYDKAVEEYQKILAEDPRDVRTLLKVGDLRLKAEQYPDAITTYETVGQFYLQQKALPKALAVYKQIREIIKKHVPHLEDRFGHVVPKLAEIYTQLGYMGDALATYDELVSRLTAAGRDRDVIDVFRKVADLDPSNPIPLLRLADAYMRVRDIDEAIAKLGQAAEILRRLGRRDEALKVVERLLQHRPEPPFCRLAAEIYLERAGPNDGMAALTKLQVAFKDNPRDLETLGLLARAFDLLGQGPKAVEVLKEAARIAKEAGKLDAFNALVETLLTRAPKDDGVRALAAMRSQGSRTSIPPVPASVGPGSVPPESISVASVSVASPSSAPAAPPDIKPRLSADAQARIQTTDPRASIDVELDDFEHEQAEVESRPFALKNTPLSALSDPAMRARYIVQQAEALRRDRNFDEAIAVLEGGIDLLPDARELREKLYDLLIEAEDQPRAIQHMIAFARRLAETGDLDAAASQLDEVMLLEPGHPEATALLAELGYAVPQGYETATITEASYEEPAERLPQYDLDDHAAPAQAATPSGQELDQIDDPFAEDQPLPQFDIEDAPSVYPSARPSYDPGALDAAQTMYGAPQSYGTGSYAPVQMPTGGYPSVQVPPPPPAQYSSGTYASVDYAPPSVGGGQFDEAALEEVEFFASQGMFEDARALLDEQLARLPNHPLLLERKRELEAMAAAPNESGARVAPRSVVPVQPQEDRAFDIAAALDNLDQLDSHTDSMDQQQISVESVFEQFKAGVAAQVSESDAATHYDLGVAYKEMGLFTDAISEFEVAARDPGRECVCQSMIGMLHMQLGNLDAGIDALIRSLHAAQKTREQELAITYEIADAYEQGQNPEQALYYFQRLQRAEPKYYDPRGAVADRVRKLSAPKAMPARAVGQDLVTDDFDAAFDELLGGKLP